MMDKDRLIQWVWSNKSKVANLSIDELKSIFGDNFAMMKGYSQNNPHHRYDLLEHTIKTVENLNFEFLSDTEITELTIAALYHDVGKPLVASEKDGRTVFYGHARKSKELAESIFKDANLGDCAIERILFLIEHHDDFIPFKLKSEIKDNKNSFVVPISYESVYEKILSVQESCRNKHIYIPTLYDYNLMIRLCIADSMAQSVSVIQNGVIIDSLEQKVKRLQSVQDVIKALESSEKNRCDLHTHSNFSDGTDTPYELVSRAVSKGIKAVALTDHNTIDGLDDFINVAKQFPIDAVPGIEFSTEFENKELHIVALFVKKPAYKKINRYLSVTRDAKVLSNKLLIQKLQDDGYDVTYEELEDFAVNNNINRAVIAQYLLGKGYLDSVKEGFQTILSKESKYYVPPHKLCAIETIKFIKSIGSIAVLAHPLLDMSYNELEHFLVYAKSAGLDAIETDCSLFTKEQRKYLRGIVQKCNLLESGGSDYHGDTKPNISLGTGTGDLFVPLTSYLDMIKIISTMTS